MMVDTVCEPALPPVDQPYGRGSVIVDPFGHRWMLLRRPARATGLRQGDVANVTMVARDAHRAKEFYEAVLRVPFSSGHPGAWRTGEPGVFFVDEANNNPKPFVWTKSADAILAVGFNGLAIVGAPVARTGIHGRAAGKFA